MKNNRTFSYYVTSFFKNYLPGQKNLSINTIHAYADAFKLFFIFCEEEKKISSDKLTLEVLNCNLVVDYLNWLEHKRCCKITTRNQRLIALHSFCRFVQKMSPENMENLQGIIEIDFKKSKKTIVSYLTEEQMKLLLAQPNGNSWLSYRDKVMLSVLYDTGARVQEICDLRIKDVRLETPAIITLTGKGNKIRQVPIMSGTQILLKSYLANYSYNKGISAGDNPLFVNQKRNKLSRWGVSHIINKYVESAKSAGLNVDFPITPHVFRHSKAVHMVHAGINLIYIRDLLGHVDCSTTEIYAKIDTETKRKAIEAACIDLTPNDNLSDWKDDNDLMMFLKGL